MKKRTMSTLVPAALTALAIGQPAVAQTADPTPSTTEAELAALRARVATLENTTNKGLSFSLANGTTIELYGYIKGDFMYDSDYNLGSTTFGLKSIGTAGGPAAGNFTRAQARQSRFGFNIDAGDFKAKVEGDFFGAGGTQAYRLRHAYGQWNGILVGQTWSNFMPLDSYPGTIDFQGPAGIPFARVGQVRYTYDTGSGLAISGSIENDVSGNASQPAITVAGIYKLGDKGSVRVAGISRSATIGGFNVNPWGVTIGGVAHLWRGGTIVGNYTQGDANSDMLVFGFGGIGPQVTAAGVETRSNAANVGISQDIGNKITLAAAVGQTQLSDQIGTATRKIKTMHLTAWYKPVKNVKFGLEFFRGWRYDATGATFTADRVQFAGQFSF